MELVLQTNTNQAKSAKEAKRLLDIGKKIRNNEQIRIANEILNDVDEQQPVEDREMISKKRLEFVFSNY